MNIFKKILVPVDGSRHALDAVHLAARLGKTLGAELILVHVVDDLLVDQLSRFSKKERKAVREELKSSAKGFLEDMRSEASKELAAQIEIRIGEGIPHEYILKEASAKGADLIVMGKLGRRGVGHILLGSVAERVIEFSEIPVLLVNRRKNQRHASRK